MSFRIDQKTRLAILVNLENSNLMKGEEDTLTPQEVEQMNRYLKEIDEKAFNLRAIAMRARDRKVTRWPI